MSEEGTDGPSVGLVGADDAVTRAARQAAVRVASGDASSVLAADPDVVVAVGEAAVLAVASQRPAPPVLPVAAGPGLRSIPPSAVADALARYGSDDWETIAHPVVSVAIDGADDDTSARGGDATALLDACLVTAEPATISEYTVATADQHVATVRADGIAVATPAGTRGYARAVGAPVVSPGPPVLAVAPIAPFQTDPDTWILPDDQVTVTVERDATPVTVLADDRRVGEVGAGMPVELARSGTLETVLVPESTSSFVPADGELEKH